MARKELRPIIPPEDEPLPIGTRLRALRWRKGMSVTQFSKRLEDYSKSFVSEVETGKANASEQSLEDFCFALGLSLRELQNIPREQILEWINERQTPRNNTKFP